MKLATFALIAIATLFLIHKWLSSMPDTAHAIAGASLGLTIAAVALWMVTL